MLSRPFRVRSFFSLLCVLGVAILGVHWPQQLHAQQTATRGIVVLEVAQGSAGDKAGILAGDVLRSWQRAASAPASPAFARGTLTSPFDLTEIEIEHAPRGSVTLLGSRGTKPLAVLVPPGRWGITSR